MNECIHRFAASEGSRDCRRAALHGGEESVEDPLSGEEGVVRRQLVRHRPRLTDRPYLKIINCVLNDATKLSKHHNNMYEPNY